MFQDTLFSVVPAVLLIAFVGTVFVLRTFVARALAAWGVRFGGGTAGLGRATEGPVMPDDGSGRAALESFAARRGLTKREVEVLLLLAEGRNEPYICLLYTSSNVSEHTSPLRALCGNSLKTP